MKFLIFDFELRLHLRHSLSRMYTVFFVALSVGDFPGKSSVAARIRSIYRRLGCYNQKGLVS